MRDVIKSSAKPYARNIKLSRNMLCHCVVVEKALGCHIRHLVGYILGCHARNLECHHTRCYQV